jgi:tetratricopeptide (TPR) repeat protein
LYDFRKEYDSAIAEYQSAIALKSDYAKAMNALGKTYMKTAQLNKAREALEAAKKADPDLTEPRELLMSFNDEPVADSPKHLKKKHHRALPPHHRLSPQRHRILPPHHKLSHPNHKLSHPKMRSKAKKSDKTRKR